MAIQSTHGPAPETLEKTTALALECVDLIRGIAAWSKECSRELRALEDGDAAHQSIKERLQYGESFASNLHRDVLRLRRIFVESQAPEITAALEAFREIADSLVNCGKLAYSSAHDAALAIACIGTMPLPPDVESIEENPVKCILQFLGEPTVFQRGLAGFNCQRIAAGVQREAARVRYNTRKRTEQNGTETRGEATSGKRAGRLPKDESEARYKALLAKVVKHPTMIDDIPALAREAGVSEKQAGRWVEQIRRENLSREK